MFNYEIFLMEELTYYQNSSSNLTTVTGLDKHRTTRAPTKRTEGVIHLTGDIMATTNVSRDNVLAVMIHKVINNILGEPTYLAMRTWFK